MSFSVCLKVDLAHGHRHEEDGLNLMVVGILKLQKNVWECFKITKKKQCFGNVSKLQKNVWNFKDICEREQIKIRVTVGISYLSIWIDSKPIVWDFSWYVSDINLVLV